MKEIGDNQSKAHSKKNYERDFYLYQPGFQQLTLRNQYSILGKVIEVCYQMKQIQELYSMLRPIHHLSQILKVQFSQKFDSYNHVAMRVMKLPSENLFDPVRNVKQTIHQIIYYAHKR